MKKYSQNAWGFIAYVVAVGAAVAVAESGSVQALHRIIFFDVPSVFHIAVLIPVIACAN